ncbi:hypothetical protein GGH95_005106 [Coemansia sp. RSA 1836]|nr:hypothetical protein GGF38_004783 [Coemansia sp. RSA 25]KAJ2557784.1 hypothetical protein GGH95_005106 [Coemansia sp. RSA 1836]
MESIVYGTYTFNMCNNIGDNIFDIVYELNENTDNGKTLRARVKVDIPESKGMNVIGDEGEVLTRDMTVREFMSKCAKDERGNYVMQLMTPNAFYEHVISSTDTLANRLSNRRSFDQLNNM